MIVRRCDLHRECTLIRDAQQRTVAHVDYEALARLLEDLTYEKRLIARMIKVRQSKVQVTS